MTVRVGELDIDERVVLHRPQFDLDRDTRMCLHQDASLFVLSGSQLRLAPPGRDWARPPQQYGWTPDPRGQFVFGWRRRVVGWNTLAVQGITRRRRAPC